MQPGSRHPPLVAAMPTTRHPEQARPEQARRRPYRLTFRSAAASVFNACAESPGA